MNIRPVSADFAVAPQIQPSDMPAIAQQGYVTVICNRPEGEEPGQPSIEALHTAAEAAGLAFIHIPVSGGAFSEQAIAAFKAARMSADGPVLAFCRSGTRSITLETLANPHGLAPDVRLQQAAVAGYDLSALSGHLK